MNVCIIIILPGRLLMHCNTAEAITSERFQCSVKQVNCLMVAQIVWQFIPGFRIRNGKRL